jgi:hypothetical protein
MTDVLRTPEKKETRRALIRAAQEVLERQGYKVGKDKGGVRGRVRQITKDGKTRLAAIRTSQDGWIAFPRDPKDRKWVTLNDVDVVVAAAIDPEQPRVAQVHMFDAKELRERFDKAYAARKKADHTIPPGRGMWVSLYLEESNDPVNRVGAGLGLLRKPIESVPLDQVAATQGHQHPSMAPAAVSASMKEDDDSAPLTIAQAKMRLARTLGVDPAGIKITVEA